MPELIAFEDDRARTYRKTSEVLAYESADAFRFSKSWGEQDNRAGSWIVVPLDEDGRPTPDAYGCDAEVFAQTYEPSPSRRPDHFRKRGTVRAYRPGRAFQITTSLADGHVEVESARATSDDAWLVRAPGGELYPIENDVFERTYEVVPETTGRYRIKTRDEHWRADGRPKRLLALDGGGTRGILTLAYLEQIETLLGRRYDQPDTFRLSHYFDVIAGTSTGAILAACLAKGMRCHDVKRLYLELAGDVFKKRWWRKGLVAARYGSRQLRKHLENVLASEGPPAPRGEVDGAPRRTTLTVGSPELQTGLIVVTKNLGTGSPWPIANNPYDRYFEAAPDSEHVANKDFDLSAVVRASTAAPSYFGPEEIVIARKKDGSPETGRFVDGGVSPHNNPALAALQLVCLEGFGLKWPLGPDKLLVVSVGTGAAPPAVPASAIAAKHALTSLLSLMNDCGDAVETTLQWLSDGPTARKIDSAMGTLAHDLLAGHPLLDYVRYDMQLEPDWIHENLGRSVSASFAAQLAGLDEPQLMTSLHDLGRTAAERQVDPGHFAARFDLD